MWPAWRVDDCSDHWVTQCVPGTVTPTITHYWTLMTLLPDIVRRLRWVVADVLRYLPPLTLPTTLLFRTHADCRYCILVGVFGYPFPVADCWSWFTHLERWAIDGLPVGVVGWRFPILTLPRSLLPNWTFWRYRNGPLPYGVIYSDLFRCLRYGAFQGDLVLATFTVVYLLRWWTLAIDVVLPLLFLLVNAVTVVVTAVRCSC